MGTRQRARCNPDASLRQLERAITGPEDIAGRMRLIHARSQSGLDHASFAPALILAAYSGPQDNASIANEGLEVDNLWDFVNGLWAGLAAMEARGYPVPYLISSEYRDYTFPCNFGPWGRAWIKEEYPGSDPGSPGADLDWIEKTWRSLSRMVKETEGRKNPPGSFDRRIRELQRRGETGDQQARMLLMVEAHKAGEFGRPMTYQGPDDRFVGALKLMGYLGDPAARRLLKGDFSSRWSTRLAKTPGNEGFGCGPVAFLMGIAATRSVLPLWERVLSGSGTPLSPEELAVPHDVVAVAEDYLRYYLEEGSRRWEDMGGLVHTRCTSMHPIQRLISPEVGRRSAAVSERMNALVHTLGFEFDEDPIEWWDVHPVVYSPRHTEPFTWAAETALGLSVITRDPGWDLQNSVIRVIGKAEEAHASTMAPNTRAESAVAMKWARKIVKEAMRREVVPFITGGMVPA